MIYRSESGDMRMVLTGDTMLARRLTPFDEPDYLALVELVRGADVAFTNLETTVRERHEGSPGASLGTPMTTSPSLLGDLRWMGFDIVSAANNHATDYGTGGVLATLEHLRRADLPFAGAGANLAESRAPGYVDTAAGRVGLVAATSFFKPGNHAADQRPDAPGRPGVNPLAFGSTYEIDDAALAALRRIGEGLGMTQERARHRAMFFSASEAPADAADSVNFLGARFRRGTGFSVSTTVDKADAEANLRWIREARRQADWVIFSFHNHEFGPAGRTTAQSEVEMEEPAGFGVDFARAAIDAGADVVAGHGPHLSLGAEIYKGRPILYSLGNFVFQNDNVQAFPAEAYGRFGLGHEATPTDFLDARTGNETRGFPAREEFWEGIVAECVFRDRRLAALRLHPVDLGHARSRAQRGRPILARGAIAERILTRVQRLSRRFDTAVDLDGETATIRLP